MPDTSETNTPSILRGTKIRIYPTPRQVQLMDLWRRRCISLWNLLLRLEMAAYKGTTQSSGHLPWRQLWLGIVEDSATAKTELWHHGKRVKNGTWKRPPGTAVRKVLDAAGLTDDKSVLDAETMREIVSILNEYDGWAAKEAAAVKNNPKKLNVRLQRVATEPLPLDSALPGRIQWSWQPHGAPLDEELMHKMFAMLRENLKDGKCGHSYAHLSAWLKKRKLTNQEETVVAWLGQHGGQCDCTALKEAAPRFAEIMKDTQPRLFIRGAYMQALMARLKQVEHTKWIGDLPSHAAQSVVDDLDKAIAAMFRELGKRARGEPARKWGMAKFKPQHYAAGSVYFANTQLDFFGKYLAEEKDATSKARQDRGRVKLPNGVGWMDCRLPEFVTDGLARCNPPLFSHKGYKGPKLLGGCIWRQGEVWYLSCQWERPAPARLPETGRYAAVKIAAAIPVTTCDDRGQTREFILPPIDKDLLERHKFYGRKQARALEARKTRLTKKKTARNRRISDQKARGQQPSVFLEKPRKGMHQTPGFYESAAKLAECESRDQAVRDEWMHQLTTSLVKQFDVICIQRMHVAEMMDKKQEKKKKKEPVTLGGTEGADADKGEKRSMKAARYMMRRVAMSRIVQTLKYKQTDLRGSLAYEEIDPLQPVVQPCARCGTLHPEMKDGRRMLRCEAVFADGTICGNKLPRNRNSARVILKELQKRLSQRAMAT